MAHTDVLLCSALLAVSTQACAAEVVVDGAPAAGDEGASGGGRAGVCEPCAEAHCSHCYLQGLDYTYVCGPDAPPPGPSCWSLDELHIDASGGTHTCLYCP